MSAVVATPPAVSAAPILEVASLSVRFSGVIAVQNVSLVVERGTTHGLIGPNGAGKSTFIDAISGFEPCKGTRSFDGVPVDGWSPPKLARAGLVRTFQNLELYLELTVRENLESAAEACGHGNGDVESIAAMLEFESVLDARIRELPHGRRRIVSIGRALAARPRLLVLDEPAAGLDTPETEWLAALLARIRESGITVLLVDHDMSLVMRVCQRISVLNAGRLLADGTPAAIIQDADVRAAYLGEDF